MCGQRGGRLRAPDLPATSETERGTMSALNGDKARFQLRRRAGLKRREHSRLAAATMRLQAGSLAATPGRMRAGTDISAAAPSVRK